jgi:selenocysteine lyase/cysteine desulfurase
MYKHLYSKFLQGHEGKLHLAAHSHHFWPDVSLTGHMRYWEVASTLSDHKWDEILGAELLKGQNHIAEILKLSNPKQIAFAPNTHELLTRLLSCFLEQKKLKVLTTKSEFHSFSRQINRLKEFPEVEVVELDNELENFPEILLQNITDDLDLIFISQVFFNSGRILPSALINQIIQKKNLSTIFVLDGYHGFCAVPTDLSAFEKDIFYLAGGYKYAQAGEGMCFMSIPENCQLRPVYTGWFASFTTLSSSTKEVQYAEDGFRFWGATQDLSALFRFNAVWDEFKKLGLTVDTIHTYVQSLQKEFIKIVPAAQCDLERQGHFLFMEFASVDETKKAYEDLLKAGIITDYRGRRLRFGFGMYQDEQDLKRFKIVNF